MPRLLPSICLAAAAGCALPSDRAAAVEVQVADATGTPLAGAAVFLASKDARAAARPEPVVEVVQIDRQFQPKVSVVTVGTAVGLDLALQVPATGMQAVAVKLTGVAP
ncbi:MAG: hypothetical protein QE285_01355 [Aquabacterium sp.]|nr:hypothetical protein [Aquabacterium sp.]